MLISDIPKKAGVYKFTNRINGKIYIGKSVNLYSRILSHKHLKPRYYIDHAIQKHGFENFDIEIIHIFDYTNETELIALETACIEEYQSLVPKGYNIMLFGNSNSGIKRSDASKKRYSLSKIGKKNPNFGKVIPRTYESYLGKNNSNFDNTIYTFKNLVTSETFTGLRQDFYLKFNLSSGNVGAVIRRVQKSVKNWILIVSNQTQSSDAPKLSR